MYLCMLLIFVLGGVMHVGRYVVDCVFVLHGVMHALYVVMRE